MDSYDALEIIIPSLKKFVEEVENNKEESYDPVEAFKALVVSFNEESQKTIVGALVEDCCDVSDKIAQVFGLLFPEYSIQKIEFLDSSQRKNFISYDTGED